MTLVMPSNRCDLILSPWMHIEDCFSPTIANVIGEQVITRCSSDQANKEQTSVFGSRGGSRQLGLRRGSGRRNRDAVGWLTVFTAEPISRISSTFHPLRDSKRNFEKLKHLH
jgi:hypothetical protein